MANVPSAIPHFKSHHNYQDWNNSQIVLCLEIIGYFDLFLYFQQSFSFTRYHGWEAEFWNYYKFVGETGQAGLEVEGFLLLDGQMNRNCTPTTIVVESSIPLSSNEFHPITDLFHLQAAMLHFKAGLLHFQAVGTNRRMQLCMQKDVCFEC